MCENCKHRVLYYLHRALLFTLLTCGPWYPQLHWIVLPSGSRSTGFLCLGHFSTFSSSFALSVPFLGRCPLPNSNLPWANRDSLWCHSLFVRPFLGMIQSIHTGDKNWQDLYTKFNLNIYLVNDRRAWERGYDCTYCK